MQFVDKKSFLFHWQLESNILETCLDKFLFKLISLITNLVVGSKESSLCFLQRLEWDKFLVDRTNLPVKYMLVAYKSQPINLLHKGMYHLSVCIMMINSLDILVIKK